MSGSADQHAEYVAIPMGHSVGQDWDTKRFVLHLDVEVRGFETAEQAHSFYSSARRSARRLIDGLDGGRTDG